MPRGARRSCRPPPADPLTLFQPLRKSSGRGRCTRGGGASDAKPLAPHHPREGSTQTRNPKMPPPFEPDGKAPSILQEGGNRRQGHSPTPNLAPPVAGRGEATTAKRRRIGWVGHTKAALSGGRDKETDVNTRARRATVEKLRRTAEDPCHGLGREQGTKRQCPRRNSRRAQDGGNRPRRHRQDQQQRRRHQRRPRQPRKHLTPSVTGRIAGGRRHDGGWRHRCSRASRRAVAVTAAGVDDSG